MATVKSTDIEGKKILTQDGTEVGRVEWIAVDDITWSVKGFEVKVRREVLEPLQLKKPMFGTRTIQLPVNAIGGVADSVVLKVTMAQLSTLLGELDAEA